MNGAELGIIVYLVLQAIAFVAYGWDKHKAVEGKWRTRESTLLVMGFFGAWGAVAGMNVFRHKTRKLKFNLNYVFLALHVVAIAVIVYQRYF